MSLTRHDAEQLLEQLYATAEVLGGDIKPAAASLMIRDLRDYDRDEIEQALARCRTDLTGRITLAAILERMPSANAFLSANEAWAVALESRDEQITVIWTDEIASAMGVATPILEEGDKIGARMAFIGAYDREVAQAKAEGRQPRWWPSLGENKVMRKEAIEQGVKDGRLPAPKVDHLLPAPDQLPGGQAEAMSTEAGREMIDHLRGILGNKASTDDELLAQERAREQRQRDVLESQVEEVKRRASA